MISTSFKISKLHSYPTVTFGPSHASPPTMLADKVKHRSRVRLAKLTTHCTSSSVLHKKVMKFVNEGDHSYPSHFHPPTLSPRSAVPDSPDAPDLIIPSRASALRLPPIDATKPAPLLPAPCNVRAKWWISLAVTWKQGREEHSRRLQLFLIALSISTQNYARELAKETLYIIKLRQYNEMLPRLPPWLANNWSRNLKRW